MKEAAETLAPVFVKHGYAFFYPCRRGHGLSADQGKFIQDELKDEEATKGIEARQKLQFALLTGPHLKDTLAALSFLANGSWNRCPTNCRDRAFIRRPVDAPRR